MATVDIDLGAYKLGWSDQEDYVFKPEKGLNEDIIRQMSHMKDEPDWMLQFRLKAYQRWLRKPIPQWGGGGLLDEIDFDDIYYYIKPTEGQAKDWDMVPDSIKETYEKLGIPEAERKYLAGVTAQYECLRGDVRVYTAGRGPVPIKEIQAGDEVFALDEETGELTVAPVRGAAQTDVRQTYRITVGGRYQREIHATDNHPILTLVDNRQVGRQRARYERQWKTVAELGVGDLVAVARDVPEFGTSHILERLDSTPNHYPTHTTPDLMWFLGYWLGDGYLRNEPAYGTYRLELAAPERDPEVRKELARIGFDLFGITAATPDEWRITVTAKDLVHWLEANKIFGNSHTKRIPEWVYALPRAERLAFLGGYVDADGYVSPDSDGNVLSVTSVSTALLGDVGELAEVTGMRPSGPHRFESRHPHDESRTIVGYRLSLGGDVERLDVRNPRRSERLGKRAYRHSDTSARDTTFRTHCTDTLGFARVVAKEEADIAPVYDIEVDGPHNFVAEGIVVHNSEVVYHKNREDLEKLGVLFTDMDTAVREYPEIVQEYFGTVIPPNDNKFAALNSAVWSGGSFIYVPPGVHLDQPLQAYFRINAENMGQFERTLIIVDEGAYVHYVEGCSAPIYSTDSLHSAVVEIVVKKGGRCRYTTIQNWSNNVYNLVTKRAATYENATMEWVDGNLGCLAEGSTVTTPSGSKPIELVIPGEQVLSFDESAGRLVWSPVVAKRFSGRQPVREVGSGVRRLRVTDNHPFYSYSYDPDRAKKLGRYALGYVRADSLEQAVLPTGSIDFGHPHKLVLPEPVTTFRSANQYTDEFESTRARRMRLTVTEETTDDLMWLFGLYLGDGSIDAVPAANGGHRSGSVTFSVPASDRARPRLMETMEALLPEAQCTERVDGVAVKWSSVELLELLLENGFGGTAATKRVPGWVFDLPESQRVSFLAGYLDADGCAPRGRRGLSAKSVNLDLLEDIGRILTGLGIPARTNTEFDGERPVIIKGAPTVARGAHRIDFPADPRVVEQLSFALQEAVLAQSQPKLRHFRRVGRSKIELPESVEIRPVEVSEHLGTVPTWDIEVAGTGNFISEGFIVHNSKLTMKYPAVWLLEPGAHGEVLSIAFAGPEQHQDAGAKMVHAASDTTSTITSKSISRAGGRAGYRGLVRVEPGAERTKSFVRCDALILDDHSRSDTYPYMEIEEADAEIGHEATVSKVGEDQLFYLMSRGLTEDEATSMIVAGFIEPIVKELPMEYAVEMNRLIELNMVEAGAIG